jgi:hypothetical protein
MTGSGSTWQGGVSALRARNLFETGSSRALCGTRKALIMRRPDGIVIRRGATDEDLGVGAGPASSRSVSVALLISRLLGMMSATPSLKVAHTVVSSVTPASLMFGRLLR